MASVADLAAFMRTEPLVVNARLLKRLLLWPRADQLDATFAGVAAELVRRLRVALELEDFAAMPEFAERAHLLHAALLRAERCPGP